MHEPVCVVRWVDTPTHQWKPGGASDMFSHVFPALVWLRVGLWVCGCVVIHRHTHAPTQQPTHAPTHTHTQTHTHTHTHSHLERRKLSPSYSHARTLRSQFENGGEDGASKGRREELYTVLSTCFVFYIPRPACLSFCHDVRLF